MSADWYFSFDQLFAHEAAGKDYRIVVEDKGSDILIMAPHGGRIEPSTSEIARSIAGANFSLYLFEGLRKRPHSELHVTSHRYDEPLAVQIAKKCETVVAIHGRKDGDDAETVWIGGLDAETGRRIEEELSGAGFCAKVETEKLAAAHPNNICNRGQTSRGVQLEIPKSLRTRLQKKPETLKAFSHAIRKILLHERQ